MNLTHFPAEILAHILSSPDSSSLCIRLWKTGDRLLHHRLSRVAISLELQPSRSEFQSPSVVAKFPGIRRFALVSRTMTCIWSYQGIKVLEMLPRTLESLKLDFNGAHDLLTNHDLERHISDPEPIETRYSHDQSRCIDLNTIFPHLTSLKLGKVRFPSLTPQNLFPVLPPTLTELSMDSLAIQTAPFASMLPRSLIKLDCTLNLDPPSSEFYEAAWIDPPPHLEYIWHINFSARPEFSFEPSWLPKSITLIGSCSLQPSQDLCLPTKRLFICDLFQIPPLLLLETSRLPSTLTYLTLGRNLCLPLTDLHCLPPSLTRLCSGIIWSDQDLEDAKKLDLSTLWPPTLTHLDLDETKDFDVFMALLPPTLEILKMPNHCQQRMDLRALPPLLHSLSAPDPQLVDHWPSNIKSLKITSSTNFDLWPTLPSSLTKFTWSKKFGCWNNLCPIKLFPSQMTTLKLARWPSVWFRFLPRTTTELTISDHLILPSNAIDKPDHFPELPNSLTKLNLSSEFVIKLSSTSLAHLWNLTDLDALRTELPSGAIVYLPRMMTSLQTSLTSVNPPDLGFLPLTLTRCKLGLDPLHLETFNYWPSEIARLMPAKVRLSTKWKSFL